MVSTIGEKEIKTNWPNEEGLTAGTTKQTGMSMGLEAEEGSNVPMRVRVGL